jgi:hypothetical protein
MPTQALSCLYIGQPICDLMIELLAKPYLRAMTHCNVLFCIVIFIILDAINDRNNESTCICKIPPAAQSNNASFQNVLDASKVDTGDLGSIMCGNCPDCIKNSINNSTLDRYTRRNMSCHFLVQMEHEFTHGVQIMSLMLRPPVARYDSPRACWQPQSRQKKCITSCSSDVVRSRKDRLAVGPNAYFFFSLCCRGRPCLDGEIAELKPSMSLLTGAVSLSTCDVVIS